VTPRKTVFSGVGKSEEEMRQALAAGIQCFNVESESELARLERVAAETGTTAAISLRINPDIDPRTHPYIATGLKESKFGVPYDEALALYRRARALPHISIAGVGCHIGSQITELAPFVAALDRVLELADRLRAEGITLAHVDIGGGLGIRYRDESPPGIPDYARALTDRLGSRAVKLLLEPGRSLVGQAGLLLTRVEYLKHGAGRNFAVVDAAMNDLIRPALYDAYHEILPVTRRAGDAIAYDVVGPVCETGDFLASDRRLAVVEGDLLAIMAAGAYGMSMSSNYNTRPRAAEVMADDGVTHATRSRETVSDLMAREIMLP
jgi:diaminopimelate decarboxylase